MRKLRVRDVPRERDEEVLEYLQRRDSGHTWAEIGRAFSKSAHSVWRACHAVEQADDGT